MLTNAGSGPREFALFAFSISGAGPLLRSVDMAVPHACSKKRDEYTFPMTQAVAQILAQAEQLSPPERADLADRLVERLAHNIPPEIERAQIEEVRRRIAQVESGEVRLIPGEQALEQVRRLVASARKAS